MVTAPEQEPVVRVTLAQIYSVLLSVQSTVADLAGKSVDQAARIGDLAEDARDHEQRIRELEKSRWPLREITVLVGVLALVASVAAILLSR